MSSSGDLGQQMRSLVESLIERGIRLDEAHEQLHRNTLRRKLERHGLL